MRKKWYREDEFMPIKQLRVLVFNGQEEFISHIHEKGTWRSRGGESKKYQRITHWRFLPQIPPEVLRESKEIRLARLAKRLSK
jgi:hypothetical protein